MIDPNYQMPVSERKEFDLLPANTYQVMIEKIELRPSQPVWGKEGEKEDRLNFTFVIIQEGKFKNRKLWKDCAIKVNPAFAGGSASNLYSIFSAANNINLTDIEAKSVSISDINLLEKKQLKLIVQQKLNKKGVMKNVIDGYLPAEQMEFSATLESEAKSLNEMQQPEEDEIDVDSIPF